MGIALTAARAYVAYLYKIVVYDTATMQMIKEIAVRGTHIWNISLSRDEKSLFVTCEDLSVRIINPETGKRVNLCGHDDRIRCVIQGEGDDVLTCSNDNTVRRWNSSTGACLKIYRGHTDPVNSILYDRLTKRIFSASNDNTIAVWDAGADEKIGMLEGHREVAVYTGISHPTTWPVTLVPANSATKRTFTDSLDGLTAWNAETGVRIGTVVGKYEPVVSIVQVNDTTFATITRKRGLIELWNMTTLGRIKSIYFDGPAVSLAATPDGQYLISGSVDGDVNIWSVATSRCVHTILDSKDTPMSLVVSTDGRFIASGGLGGITHMFSVSPPFSRN